MKEIIIGQNENDLRLDKLLFKFLNRAPSSFVYKMLRKKNITLNNKKACGKEKLAMGDSVKLWLADDTIDKFSKHTLTLKAPTLRADMIIYEDKDVLIINKPASLLTQKAEKADISVNDMLLSYLKSSTSTFRPSICNRLDRNTSGLIICGKSLTGLQTMNSLIQYRAVDKRYICIVKGLVTNSISIKGYLLKDEKTNTVSISDKNLKNGKYIETECKVLYRSDSMSVLEVKLITGRTHQIRASLASIAHPILGDEKYGDTKLNKSMGLTHQLLHAYKLVFPELKENCTGLSKKVIIAPIPDIYKKICGGYTWQLGNRED